MADERDQIRERLSIETLVGEHVALKRSGRNLMGLCPFHKEKSPSFVVSPERGSFHCFGCGASGDIFRFQMLINKVEFPDALRALAARTGVELDPEAARRKSAEARTHEVLAAVTLYLQQALASKAGENAREYLASRGISRETWERFALGYLPDWGDGLRRELPRRGISEQELLDATVLLPSEQGREPFSPFHNRLIFPIRDQQGHVCGFGGRILGEGQPKYLNSRQSTLFDKSNVLYTIDRAAEAIRAIGEAVVVEGYMDALRAHQDGFANVVASLGTAITPRQLALLQKLTSRVVLALDADPAGARAAAEAGVRATIALPQKPSDSFSLGQTSRPQLKLYIATLPAGSDPDEVIAANPAVWRAAIAEAQPAMDHYLDLVLASLDKTQPAFVQDLLSALLPLIGQLPLGVQQPYLERISTITRIETAALRGELARLRGETRRGARAIAAPQAELQALRQAANSRDPRARLEEELLRFLLRQTPLPDSAMRALAGVTLSNSGREKILHAVLTAHGENPLPDGPAIVAGLDPETRELGESLMSGPALPLIETAKLPEAVGSYVLRLERMSQSERLREQGALLDQLDAESARALLNSTQDLVASRNDLTRRMLEEQAKYHLQ